MQSARLNPLPLRCTRVSIRLSVTVLTLASLLTACGGRESSKPLESAAAVTVGPLIPGVTPFIQTLTFEGSSIPALAKIQYVIEPMPGSASRAITISYSKRALEQRGYLKAGGEQLQLPIIGLYAGYKNTVKANLYFIDDSKKEISTEIETLSYTDPNKIYDQPKINVARLPGKLIGFDFFAMKSSLGTPVIIDTDGKTRWVGSGVSYGLSSIFQNGRFVIGDPKTTEIYTLELDGAVSKIKLQSAMATNFHHNIDPGKTGLFGAIDGIRNSVAALESNLVEFSEDGAVIKEWDMAEIFSQYMRSQGDDPALFVYPGIDWFHMNAATYDPRDDSIVISSRENFLVKIDYASGKIIWIFGDPSKYWYTFPSLRAKALTLEAGGLYPLGQHSVSITSDGLLLVFNNGYASLNQPVGMPVGENRNFSTVSAYSIDTARGLVEEKFNFDYGRSIYSSICSSVYKTKEDSLLIDYSVANSLLKTRIVGVDAQKSVIFDFEYPSPGPCQSAWNSVPIPLEDLHFE